MKKFLADDFLLSSPTAVYLYKNYAKDQPIIDYHCHINPRDIALNVSYENMAQIWLTCGDHYKWRAIRTVGYDESYVTGDRSDYEKFRAFACAMPSLIGNPLYHWAHMELRKYFGCKLILCEENCDEIWEFCNKKLADPALKVRSIIENSKVEVICSTDDPSDTLEYHAAIAADNSFKCKVLPTFRPDKGFAVDKPGYAAYIASLAKACGTDIADFDSLTAAYLTRLDHFAAHGCRLADHGFEGVPFRRAECKCELDTAFKKAMSGEALTQEEIDAFKTELFLLLSREYSKRGWTLQIHFGAGRNNSDKLFKSYGADAGGDAIGNYNCIMPVSRLLNALDVEDTLPKTILYSLNPIDNTAIDALIGCFQGGIRGKLQHGSAWWFNDNISGMKEHLTGLANNSALGCFVGMLTDSRSFLSYARHDYFRRILCDFVGEKLENGEYPDIEIAGKIVADICYGNANAYFGF